MMQAISKKHADQIAQIYKRAGTSGQRTKEWFDFRSRTIGGSEIASLIGKSKYKNIEQLYKSKLDLENVNSFGSRVAMQWGTYFEPVTTRVVEMLFGTVNNEFGSLVGPVPYSSYSPDGVAVVTVPYCDLDRYSIPIPGWQHDFELNYILKLMMIMFEFKAPYTRVPSGIIPEEYIPQLYAGLATIPEAELSLFINNQFKSCTVMDLTKRDTSSNLYASGIILLMSDEPCNYTPTHNLSTHEKFRKISELNTCELKLLFSMIENKKIKPHYCEPFLHTPSNPNVTCPYNIFIDRFVHNDFIQTAHPFGPWKPCEYTETVFNQYIDFIVTEYEKVDPAKIKYILPWKLININMIVQKRVEPNFLIDLAPKIKEFMENVIRLRNIPNNMDRFNELDKIITCKTKYMPDNNSTLDELLS